MGGLGCGATRRGSSWGPVSQRRSDPDPPGDENTRIGAAPAAPEKHQHHNNSAASRDSVFRSPTRPPHNSALKAASGPCGSSKRDGLGQRQNGNASASGPYFPLFSFRLPWLSLRGRNVSMCELYGISTGRFSLIYFLVIAKNWAQATAGQQR